MQIKTQTPSINGIGYDMIEVDAFRSDEVVRGIHGKLQCEMGVDPARNRFEVWMNNEGSRTMVFPSSSEPILINGRVMIASRPATLAKSEICDVIVCRDAQDYVVWTYNRQLRDASSGQYRLSLPEAVTAFKCRHSSVSPVRWTLTPACTEDEATWFDTAAKM